MQALRSSFGAMFRSGARAAVATSPVNSIATLRPGLGVASLQHVFGWGPIAAGQVRTMRHGQMRGKLSRSPKRRWHMLRNLVTDLVSYERLMTTVARAKELRKIADWVVTMGKKGTLRSRRQAQAVFRTDAALHKTFSVLAERYKDRVGGYTRVLRHRVNRKGDNAPMAFIEFVDREGELRESKPPVYRLPYSKMLVRAESAGDAELVEYYKERQKNVVAAAEKRLQLREVHKLKTGRHSRKYEPSSQILQPEESSATMQR